MSFHNVEAIHATDKALLCTIGGSEAWVPFSQIQPESEVNEPGEYGTLVVTQWWAEVAGVSDYASEVPEPVRELPQAQRVYRKLIFEFHPDRNPSGDTVARALNELWQAVQADLRSSARHELDEERG